jgi:hypothetical protein
MEENLKNVTTNSMFQDCRQANTMKIKDTEKEELPKNPLHEPYTTKYVCRESDISTELSDEDMLEEFESKLNQDDRLAKE